MTPPDGPGPTQTRSRRSTAVVILAAVAAVGVVIALVAGWRLFGPPADYDGTGTGTVRVTITQGASAKRIGSSLLDAGVVASQRAFVQAAQSDPRSRSIAPGTYALAQRMSAEAALARLLDPAARITAKVVVREGATVRSVAQEITTKAGIPAPEVAAALANPSTLGLPSYAGGQLEGFLYPATYDTDPGDSASDVLRQMVSAFTTAATDLNLERRAAQQGLTPQQVVTIASLAQAEVADPADFPKVSRVIRNRLAQGIPLQFDTSVVYALGGVTRPLTLKDLQVDSPYNLYRNKGLPPGPISSPSREALEAALSPARGPWIYFVTTNPTTGETKFTDSYQEFLRYKAEFKANSR